MDRRSWLKITSFAAALGAWGAAGCSHDDGTALHVICAIKPTISSDTCTFDPAGTSCVFDGVLNLEASDHYTEVLQVQSGLAARASSASTATPHVEPNRMSLLGGTVEIRKPDGSPLKFSHGLKNPYPFLGSGSVPPGGTGAMTVTLLPAEYVAQLRQNAGAGKDALEQIDLAVVIHARTDGEISIKSGEWFWPVRLISQSPVSGDGECQDIDYCLSLGGIDDFATACLCKAESGKNSCKIE
jgi:hypothetical protein